MKALFFFSRNFCEFVPDCTVYIPEDNFQSHRCQLHIMLPLDIREKWQNEPGGLVSVLNKLRSGGTKEYGFDFSSTGYLFLILL
jgi:hypothetical protein